VLFVCTANDLSTISGPLRDRMEIIQLSGYTEFEKLQIAKRYLVKKQREANGLRDSQVQINDAALRAVINDYTREAGVRNLEREIGTVFRKVARKHRGGAALQGARQTRNARRLPLAAALLQRSQEAHGERRRHDRPRLDAGRRRHHVHRDDDDAGQRQARAHGSARRRDEGVAQAAVSFLRSRSGELGLQDDYFSKHDLHIHVPAGATPKDGPSAGIALATSIASLLTNTKVDSNLAMTGEITLTGQVLPIGGLKEKVSVRQARRHLEDRACRNATRSISTTCRRKCATR
jgi:ATP-dependent Lon protease